MRRRHRCGACIGDLGLVGAFLSGVDPRHVGDLVGRAVGAALRDEGGPRAMPQRDFAHAVTGAVCDCGGVGAREARARKERRVQHKGLVLAALAAHVIPVLCGGRSEEMRWAIMDRRGPGGRMRAIYMT